MFDFFFLIMGKKLLAKINASHLSEVISTLSEIFFHWLTWDYDSVHDRAKLIGLVAFHVQNVSFDLFLRLP